jgi:hypothetical protein
MKRMLSWIVGVVLAGVVAIGVSWVFNTPDKALRGVWKTDGYGLMLDVSATTIDVYQYSDVHCVPDQTIPAHTWLVNFLEGVTFTPDGDRLLLSVAGLLNPIYADKIDSLPASCDEGPANDPTTTFDVMWETMNTHYAHFDTHGVDWAARKSLRPAPGTTLDDADMLALIKETLTGLDDGHTYIATGTDVWSPSLPSTWHDDRRMVRDTTIAAIPDLSEPSPTGLRVGWATPDIGYVYMTHMDPDAGLGQRQDVAASHAFDQIATFLAGAKSIILDVRYNPGGSDDVSMAYAGYFTNTALPAFTKITRTETGYTAPYQAVLEPQRSTLDVPVIVLTSPYTGSAAEIFTMTMRELPQVTTMGTPTSGGLSDVMSVKLPNGWELGLSHQVYTTMAGENFERVGITPDITVALDVAAARTGTDNVLNAAIAHLSEQ